MEIIYNTANWEQNILAIHLGNISDYKWTRFNCWQYISLNIANDLTMTILISDKQFIWR